MSKSAVVQGVVFEQGIWSNMKGEGRWAANIAYLFKRYGLNVNVSGEGEIDPRYVKHQCGINFVTQYGQPYDLSFVPCPLYRDSHWMSVWQPRAKKMIFGTFWPSNETLPDNSIMVHPRRRFPEFPNVKVLPYIFIDQFEEPKFDNHSLVWVTRGVISRPHGPNAPGGMNVSCLNYLKVMLKAAIQGYSVKFLCFDEASVFAKIPEHKETPLVLEAQKVIRKLQELGNVKFLGSLPYDQFIKEMKTASVAVRLDNAPGSLEDSLLHGVAPTLFHAFYYPSLVKEKTIPGVGFASDANNISEEVIEERIFKLLTDRDYYNMYLQNIRDNTRLYTTEDAFNLLEEVLDVLF